MGCGSQGNSISCVEFKPFQRIGCREVKLQLQSLLPRVLAEVGGGVPCYTPASPHIHPAQGKTGMS